MTKNRGVKMRRRKFRSRSKKGRKRRIFFFTLIIAVFLILQSFIYIEKNLREPLMSIAQMRIKQIATQSINRAITERVAQDPDINRLIDWQFDRNGKTTGFMINYSEHMRITSDAVQIVQRTLEQLQQRQEYVPIGQALNSPILASIGPDVPIRLVPAGAVKVDLSTRQKDAGINMVLVEIYLRIITEVAVIIPFDSGTEIVQTDVPLSYLLVVGDVPMYYFDNKGRPLDAPGGGVLPPTISLPEIRADAERGDGWR
jgi:sporulation protein YunB